jgi:hypothetical protein
MSSPQSGCGKSVLMLALNRAPALPNPPESMVRKQITTFQLLMPALVSAVKGAWKELHGGGGVLFTGRGSFYPGAANLARAQEEGLTLLFQRLKYMSAFEVVCTPIAGAGRTPRRFQIFPERPSSLLSGSGTSRRPRAECGAAANGARSEGAALGRALAVPRLT